MTAASVKDVARRAGVSAGTVSNVLNRPEIVRPATRARVEQAIAELGFVRNESARHLRAGHSRIVVYQMLDQRNPFFTDLSGGIEKAVRDNGLGLFLCSSGNDPAREDDYLALLLEQRIGGLLITAADYDNQRLRDLPNRDIPVVFVDRLSGPDADWCSVGVDDVEGGSLAVSHLLDQGHRRIGFVGGPLSTPQVADRRIGALQALQTGGADVAELAELEELTMLETERLDVAEGRRAGARLLGLPQRRRPTGVLCANDLVALGLLQEMTQQGVAVPDELAIVGYDDIEFAAAAAIPLTSVRQPRFLLGNRAAELLIDEMRNERHKHEQVRFSPELIVRGSSRATRPGRQAG